MTERLVLTAAHVIGRAGGEKAPEIGVRPLGAAGWFPASLGWIDYDLDAALVRIEAPEWSPAPGAPTVRWGRPGGTDPLFCSAVGFPWAAERPGGVRDTEQLYGHVAPLGGMVSGLVDVNVTSAAPLARPGGSPWAGMSGAGLVVAGYLVGVVVVDPARYGTDRVRARPVADLVANADFCRVLGADGAPVPADTDVVGDRWRLQLGDGTGVGLAPPYQGLPVGPGPAALLDARYGLVPYRGREALIGRLVEWCTADPGPLWVCVVTGDGGSGKTRLAAEVCTRMLAAGWDGGFTSLTAPADTVRERLERPTLLILDDADIQPDLAAALVRHIRADAAGPPARLLLLARHLGDHPGSGAGVGWWAQLDRNLELEDVYAGVLDVSDHPLNPPERAEHYQLAFDALRQHVPNAAAKGDPVELADPDYAQPLLVHMAALISAYGDPVPDSRPPDLLRRASADAVSVRTRVLRTLLGREAYRWQRLGEAVLTGSAPTLPGQVIALATLSAAADRPSATGLLRLVPDLEDASAERRGALAEWGHQLYAGRAFWNPIRPDPLAEQHLADTTEVSILALALAQAVIVERHAQVGIGVLSQLLGELTRAAAPRSARTVADPAQPSVRAALQELIDQHLAGLVSMCVDTADAALALLTSQALRLCPSPPGAAAAVGTLPERSLALADLAAELCTQAVTHRRREAQTDEAFRPDLVGALNDQSRWFSALGRPEDALTAINEAVSIYRQLGGRPDAPPAHLALLLNNQGSMLSKLGRREDALTALNEAVSIYRLMADHFLPSLASCLNNQGNMLTNLGRHEDALTAISEAVATCRELADARPDAYLPNLAMSLNSQYGCLRALGQPEDALAAVDEAATIYRGLADTRPDAFRADLAVALTNLGNMLNELFRHEDALAAINEAVATCRELADARPDAYLPDLASSLTYLSNVLGKLDKPEDALTAIDEAVAIRRELSDARPSTFQPDLAISLNNQANRLSELGRTEDALAAIGEAVAIYRRLADARPDAALPNLASSLYNQASMLDKMDRSQDALAAIAEAVTIYRRLAAARPDAALPNLASSLSNHAFMLAKMGWPQDAVAASNEAVTIYRRLANARPDTFLPRMSASLHRHSEILSSLSRPEDALAAISEAATIDRQLADARPDTFLPSLAGSLYNQCRLLSDLSRPQDALAAITQAIITYRQLADARPDAFLPDLAESLNRKGNLLSSLSRPEDALAAFDETVTIYRQLADARPGTFPADLVMCLHNQCVMRSNLGRPQDALAASKEAVDWMLAYPERASSLLPDNGLVIQMYFSCCEANGQVPDPKAVLYIASALQYGWNPLGGPGPVIST